jgi:hypothetical protein
MTGSDEIAEVFGLFHDGWISNGTFMGGNAEIVVEIEYLAERVRPTYRRFTIHLEDVDAIRFSPWIEVGSPSVPCISNFSEIVGLQLGLLSAEAADSIVRVACTQDQRDRGFSGGVLEIAAAKCRIFDEGGEEWTLTGLGGLAEGYWEEWAAPNKQPQQDGAEKPATRPESK